jgi:hypothetical protein
LRPLRAQDLYFGRDPFRSLRARGQEAAGAGRWDEASGELRAAMDVWRGEPLAAGLDIPVPGDLDGLPGIEDRIEDHSGRDCEEQCGDRVATPRRSVGWSWPSVPATHGKHSALRTPYVRINRAADGSRRHVPVPRTRGGRVSTARGTWYLSSPRARCAYGGPAGTPCRTGGHCRAPGRPARCTSCSAGH